MTSLPQVAPRIAKLTALSIGVALLATACGGSSTPTSTTGSASAAAAGIACPAPSATSGATTAAVRLSPQRMAEIVNAEWVDVCQ